MRRLFLALGVLTASMAAAKAQFYIGGGLGFWYEKEYRTTFNISPEAGYSFNDRWTAGLAVGFDAIIYSDAGKTTITVIDGEIYTHTVRNNYLFYVTPYARFNYFSKDRIKLFLDGVVGVSTEIHSGHDPDWGFQIIIQPGISINLTEHFRLVGIFGTLGWRYNYRNTNNGLGLDLRNSLRLGFYYSF
jgi:hypothetical protein